MSKTFEPCLKMPKWAVLNASKTDRESQPRPESVPTHYTQNPMNWHLNMRDAKAEFRKIVKSISIWPVPTPTDHPKAGLGVAKPPQMTMGLVRPPPKPAGLGPPPWRKMGVAGYPNIVFSIFFKILILLFF
jgi:hypothetical protein